MSDATQPARRSAESKASSGDTKRTVEAELAEKTASIHRRIEELEDEITSAPAALRKSIAEHPLAGVAGAVFVGVAVGLYVTGRARRRSKPASLRQKVMDEYVQSVGDEVRRLYRRGHSLKDAVSAAFNDRAPLIVYASEPQQERSSPGFFSKLASVFLDTAMTLAVKVAFEVALSKMDVPGIEDDAIDTDDAESAPPAHGGDGAAGAVDRAMDVR